MKTVPIIRALKYGINWHVMCSFLIINGLLKLKLQSCTKNIKVACTCKHVWNMYNESEIAEIFYLL